MGWILLNVIEISGDSPDKMNGETTESLCRMQEVPAGSAVHSQPGLPLGQLRA